MTEAQYQDAVRLTVDNLYTAYVDLLQARRAIAFAEAGLKGLNDSLKATEDQYKQGTKTIGEVRRIRIPLNLAEQQLLESRGLYTKARRSMANLLNIPVDQAEAIEPSGTLKQPGVVPPPLPQMIDIALNHRPDVIAYRLGVQRAKSDVRLQLANRFQDVYVLYQPYTFQDNTPFGLKSPTSWALGVTVPLPLYNRNQGNIQRSRLNVSQTQTELAAVERQAILDVQAAELEYRAAKVGVERIESSVLADATANLRDANRLFPGEINVLEYLSALKDYNDVARTYLDSEVRLRRAILEINTAVGQRLLP